MDGRPEASEKKAKQETGPHHGIGGRDPTFLRNEASLKGAANSKNPPTLFPGRPRPTVGRPKRS